MMSTEIIGRETQSYKIWRIFTSYSHEQGILLPPGIVLYGPFSSGKSYTLNEVLKQISNLRVAQLGARDVICGRRQFLESVVRQLFQPEETIAGAAKILDKLNYMNVDSFAKAFEKLGKILRKDKRNPPMILIIEDADLLRDKNSDIITLLPQVQYLVSLNVCVILVSRSPLSRSCNNILQLTDDILKIKFPQYTKEQLINIIVSEPPLSSKDNIGYFKHYVNATINVFNVGCKDLRTLKTLILLNYDTFIAKLTGNGENKQVSNTTLVRVWKSLEQKMIQDFNVLKSNIIPQDCINNDDSAKTAEETELSRQKTVCHLPVQSKYLLVSAYLASYNPKSSDKRFFVKTTVGKRRKLAKPPTEISQPHFFPVTRLWAIYASLTDSKPQFSPELWHQITDLCELRLLAMSPSSMNTFNDPNYKCLDSFNNINEIAKSINIDITKYLYSLL